MIAALVWKEYREHRAVWISMVLVALGLLLFTSQVPLIFSLAATDVSTYLLVSAGGCVLTYGVVCGSMLLAGERELGTLAFLDSLTGQRLPLWFAKVLPGLGFCLLQSVVVAILTALIMPQDEIVKPAHAVVLLPAIALDAFVWGLLASSLCGTVLTAAGWAAFLWLMGGVLLAPCGAFESPLLLILGRAILDLAILGLSAVFFCRTESLQPVILGEAPAQRQVRLIRPPTAWRVLLWLPLRQGWVKMSVLAGLAVLTGLFLPSGGPIFWLSVTTILGVICGAAVLGSEQSQGSQLFLGNQRLPLGRVWFAKVAFWLVVSVGLSALFLLVGVLVHIASTVRPSWGGPPSRLLESELLFNRDNWYILLPLGVLYGFGIGMFYSLLWRKTVVAVVLSLLVAPAFVVNWLPSLAFGGLQLWQVVAPPLLLLVGTRVVIWAWCSSGLAARRPGALLAGAGIGSILWIGAVLGDRVLEVPDVGEPFGEPFDLAAFEKSLPKPEQNEPLFPFRRAGEAFWKKLDAINNNEIKPARIVQGAEQKGDMRAFFVEQLRRAIEKGWPANDPDLAAWLNACFTPAKDQEPKDAWYQLYRNAAKLPLGAIEDPISPRSGMSVSILQCLQAGVFIEARALQCQAESRDEEALDWLLVLLDHVRHLRSNAMPAAYQGAGNLQNMALRGLSDWLGHPHDPELLGRAMKHLMMHERAMPPPIVPVKMEYARTLHRFATGQLGQDSTQNSGMEAELLPALWYAPWERQRFLRLLAAQAAASMRVAAAEPWEAIAALEHVNDPGIGPDGRGAIFCGLTFLEGPAASLTPQQWGKLLRNHYGSLGEIGVLQRRVNLAFETGRLRATYLAVALALYQAKDPEHKPAPNLEALIQRNYLREIPLDPFDGRPFRYRLSHGETIDVSQAAGPDDPVQQVVQPGQGVLWSVGPDRIDHGGVKQGLWDYRRGLSPWVQHNLDMVFVVPQPR
jgi:hypothetical protein